MISYIDLFFKQKTAYYIEYGLVGSDMCIRDSMDKLQVVIGEDELVAEHRLGSGRFQRYVLPEHEAAFYRKSRSSHLLGEQFALPRRANCSPRRWLLRLLR